MKITTVLSAAMMAFTLLPASALAGDQAAGDQRPYEITEQREACADYDPLRRPFFGDLHVHTGYSMDAATQFTRNTPRDAYRFARGEEVGLQPFDREGRPLRHARLRRPLDFTSVTDHSEMLGEVRICNSNDLPGSDSDMCWLYKRLGPLATLPMLARTMVGRERMKFCGEGGKLCLDVAADVWQDIRDAAEEAYDRSPECSFTSFVGYEWTSILGMGINMHRNVIFRNENVPNLPVSWVDTPSAYNLWEQLQDKCIDGVKGCDALTIPHNSNLSGPGLMFESAKLEGPLQAGIEVDAAEATARRRWEPLVEIMQHKGDSECMMGGDTTDEACGFEKLPYDNFAGVGRFRGVGAVAGGHKSSMVREALKKGLLQDENGVGNSLKYGIIASTDTHLGTPGLVAEDESKGHGGAGNSASTGVPIGLPDNFEFNPGGLAVVWAEENARDSLYAAMTRRETYGTSGTRPVLRFFGGWGYDEQMCDDDGFASAGYEGGVPMGSDLAARPDLAGSPLFAVQAMQDPGTSEHPGTALDRVQIVKGWVEDGSTREKVYDVAGGNLRASVNARTCRTSGIGHSSLCTVWSDPDFDAEQRAFYYARVLENPVCRWSQKLCVEAKVNCLWPNKLHPGFAACCSKTHRKVVQERAWSSPIWYTP